VADDLLRNDGQKFLEMMESLADKRIQRERDAAENLLAGLEDDENDGDDYDEDEEEDDEVRVQSSKLMVCLADQDFLHLAWLTSSMMTMDLMTRSSLRNIE
jgi:hypothetical protein